MLIMGYKRGASICPMVPDEQAKLDGPLSRLIENLTPSHSARNGILLLSWLQFTTKIFYSIFFHKLLYEFNLYTVDSA